MTTETNVVYHGLKQCSALTGIPIDVLRRARQHPDCPRSTKGGFAKSGRIYMTAEFRQWLDFHMSELRQPSVDITDYWRLRNERAKALIMEEQLKNQMSNMVEKGVINQLLARIASAQRALFKDKISQAIPARFNLTPEQAGIVDAVAEELLAIIERAKV
jgi:hypothetical protein